MEYKNRFTIKTPIGEGTAVGFSCEKDAVCVMHTRPSAERDKTHGPTFIKWWQWDDVNKEITGELVK